jgi:hypothetical protein
MDHVKFVLDQQYGYYSYQDASNVEMNVLGMFLNDVGCPKNGRLIFLEWARADKNDPHSGFAHTCGSNTILLDEDDNGEDVYLIENIGGDPDDPYYIPPRIKIARDQFIQLLEQWQEKVCKYKPQTVFIKRDNNQFFIETLS